jgi:hypothetical protein
MAQHPEADDYGSAPWPGYVAGPASPLTPRASRREQERKPATLGIVGLALVVTSIVVVVAAYLLSSVMAMTTRSSLSTTSQDHFIVGGPVIGSVLLSLAAAAVCLAGWIIGIVATSTNRGRAFGIVAIVLGIASVAVPFTMTFGAFLLVWMG